MSTPAARIRLKQAAQAITDGSKLIEDAANDLSDLAADLQSDWEERSEKWQESDNGVEAANRIDVLNDFVDELIDIADNDALAEKVSEA